VSTLNRKLLGSNLGSDMVSTLNKKVLGSKRGSDIVITLYSKVLDSNLGSDTVSTLNRKVLGSNLVSDIVSTLNRKVLGSNLGRSKRAISSPKHPDQLQNPPSLQLNVIQGFFSGIKVASGRCLIGHICLVPSLKLFGATAPLNLSASMAHTLGLYFNFTS
jgi:hypothetical protein